MPDISFVLIGYCDIETMIYFLQLAQDSAISLRALDQKP